MSRTITAEAFITRLNKSEYAGTQVAEDILSILFKCDTIDARISALQEVGAEIESNKNHITPEDTWESELSKQKAEMWENALNLSTHIIDEKIKRILAEDHITDDDTGDSEGFTIDDDINAYNEGEDIIYDETTAKG